MERICYLSALLLLFTHGCYADYVGAVVEYNPVSSTTPNFTMEENVKNYVYQIEQAKTFGVQLIVFPEYGITGLINDPENYGIQVPDVGTSDFSNSNYLLLRLSNAAKEHSLYVVVNLLENATNSNNQTFIYNTNLVFSNNGTLVARYRKINPYQEPKITPGNEVVTFTTDFGTFGVMTCADILSYNPAQTLLSRGVTDVVYPAAWTTYLPFFSALEVQMGYTLANKVTLLAANINNPLNGTGGSGIYRSDGTVLKTILTDSPATNIVYTNIVANPPSNSFSLMGFDIIDNVTQTELGNFKNLTDFQYDSYVYKSLDLSQENITEEICHGKFCCSFNILTSKNETNSSEIYKLVAYDGNYQSDNKRLRVRHCNLVACLNNAPSSCGVRPPSAYTTIFRQIVVWGSFDNAPEDFYRPTNLRGNLQPFYNVIYLESKTNESYAISFNNTTPASNVVIFGLYGRGGAGKMSVSLLFVAVAFVMKSIF